MKAMILSAGLGTRLKPWTNNHPKALFPVHGHPLLEWNLKYLQKNGIQDVVINVHHYAEQIIDFLNKNQNFGLNLSISDERDALLETGGGIKKARALLGDSHFLVINADILTDLNLDELLKTHQNNSALATLAVCNRTSSRKLFFDANQRLIGWKNYKTNESRGDCSGTEMAFSGIHVLSPEIYEKFGSVKKFSIMDTYLEHMQQETILGFDHSGSKLLDVGKADSGAQAEALFDWIYAE